MLVLKKVIPIDEEDDIPNIFDLDGYISSCDHNGGRSSKDRQFYFINSRPCEPLKVLSYFIFINLSILKIFSYENLTRSLVIAV